MVVDDLTGKVHEGVISREHTKGSSGDVGGVVEKVAKGKRDTKEGEEVDTFHPSRVVVVVDVEVVISHVEEVRGDEETTKDIKDFFLTIKSKKRFHRGTRKKMLNFLMTSETFITDFNGTDKMGVVITDAIGNTRHFCFCLFDF